MPEYFPSYRSPAEESATEYILFSNTRIFNGEELLEGMQEVLVHKNLIAKVGTSVSVPQDAKVAKVDCGGRTLLPGLIDMHAHLCFQEGMLEGRDDFDQMAMGAMTGQDLVDYLQQGFTTVRDAGGNVLGIAKAVLKGRIPGPRIFACGAFISQTGGHGDTGCCFDQPGQMDELEKNGVSHICDGRAEVLKACRNNLRNGATQIKIMAGGGCASAFDPIHITQLTPDEMKTAVEIATDYGTYVMAHAYHDNSINRCLDVGVKCIEHGFLMSEATMERIAKEGAIISLQVVMSIVAFGNPEELTFFTADQKKKAAKVHEGALRLMEFVRKYRPLFVSGGDMFGSAYQHRQSDNIIAMKTLAGFSTTDALMSATGNAGKVLAMSTGMNPYKEGKIGVIAEGAYADIIVVDGNPVDNIELLKRENVKVVLKDGKCYKYELEDNALDIVNK
mmetsp:Transcript_1149/g.1357  ORF Transcript_1149/g.1357 Transcript_1149/m.1357 type:complete len:447 (+) Transcript_1149:317-1657(+)|eukprot:CAMPEP_0184019020 /NCGR_PEP_ID=MMETSP0954-20121128/8506_1 /TAXON_ID=627963 /ORGANISM="Aplanochytrium sp, Strain PBS07" /LENGTH=446 /DNA_ID=CAMNT_0026300613 /DNA_START=247 /DNA_END=1587 /DNA_ORIENTATION=-